MKKYYLFFLLVSTCVIQFSCKRVSPNKNVVYILGAETSDFTTLTADNDGGELAILAKTSQLVSQDVVVDLEIDNNKIEAYNELTGKHYSPLPEGSYELSDNTVTISSGTNISDAIKLKVLSIEDFKDGASYIVPVTIKKAAGAPILDASKTLYVEINRIIISTVASLKNNYFTVDFSENGDNLKALNNVSFEVRVLVNSFQSRSPFISSVMGIEENFLFRFGDVTVQPNQLQMAGGATATNVSMSFSTGIWYHLAGVYDGAQLKIYVDGQLVATTDASRTIDLTDMWSGGFHFGYSAGGRLLDGEISEARVWSRALTQSEIINGMCVIDPASSGLIGYWKFNEGTGKIAHDVSGNGHDAVANRDVTWIPDVRCN